MADPRDFLTIAQEGVEAYLNANPRVKQVVKAGIVEGYTTTRSTKVPDVLAEKDLPMIRLVPVSLQSNLNYGSNMTQIDYSLRVELVTGDLRFNGGLAQVWCALFAAMMNAVKNPGILDLYWKGETYLKNIVLSESAVDVRNPNGATPSIMGWVALCDLTLQMHVAQNLLIDWSNLE